MVRSLIGLRVRLPCLHDSGSIGQDNAVVRALVFTSTAAPSLRGLSSAGRGADTGMSAAFLGFPWPAFPRGWRPRAVPPAPGCCDGGRDRVEYGLEALS